MLGFVIAVVRSYLMHQPLSQLSLWRLLSARVVRLNCFVSFGSSFVHRPRRLCTWTAASLVSHLSPLQFQLKFVRRPVELCGECAASLSATRVAFSSSKTDTHTHTFAPNTLAHAYVHAIPVTLRYVYVTSSVDCDNNYATLLAFLCRVVVCANESKKKIM